MKGISSDGIFNVTLFNCYIIKVFVLHVMCSKVVSCLTLSLHLVEASFLISRKHLKGGGHGKIYSEFIV